MNAQMLESIDDSNLDDVAGGLSFGIALDSKLLKTNVSVSTSGGINLAGSVNVLGICLNLGVGANIG